MNFEIIKGKVILALEIVANVSDTQMAWQQHFVTNMFIRPETKEEIENFEPDFTIINACSQVDEDWEKHGLNSEVAVVFNIEKKCAVIFGKLLTQLRLYSFYFLFKYEFLKYLCSGDQKGTWYGGENKVGLDCLQYRECAFFVIQQLII